MEDRLDLATVTAPQLGRVGERIAEHHLSARGLRVVDRNWRCRRGELDLIAVDGDQLVFVEVKTRRSGRHGSAVEAVTLPKLARLRRLAGEWLQAHPGVGRAARIRIDVIALEVRAGWVRIHHLEGVG